MAIVKAGYLRLLGMNVQGDVGGLTFYTSRRRGLVIFDKAPPLVPASYTQLVMRNRWRNISASWRNLSEHDREQWELACQRVKLLLTGCNLFTWWWTKRDAGTLATIIRHSGIDLYNHGAA